LKLESVSIIIVNFNGARHLEPCLSSLKRLDFPPEKYEVIVFDNGSTDRSIQVIEQVYPSAKIIRNEKNLGFAPPHRMAAQVADGSVLAFLNNDMKVDEQWLQEGVSLLKPAQGIVCSSSRIMSWNGSHVEFNGGSLQYLGYAEQLSSTEGARGTEILFPCGGAMFIMKDVFQSTNGFDDDYFAIFEDVDLGWRLWLMGYRVVLAPDSLVYHRGHGTLDSQRAVKKRFLMHRNALMTIIKNYDDGNLERILPLALSLAVKRALLFLGVDKQTFYFWQEEDSRGSSAPRNYEEGLIHLAALDDVFETFPTLLKKREGVQSARRRGDEDIFSLFKDPFRNLMGYEAYLWQETSLFGRFGLERIFDCEIEYERRLKEGTRCAEGHLETLRREIQRMALDHGVNPNKLRKRGFVLERLVRSLRAGGLRATVRRIAHYLGLP
jgi:GT2 family glycosyltransferase